MSQVVELLSRLIPFRTDKPAGDELALAQLLERELAARGPDEVRLVRVPRGPGLPDGAYVFARWGTPRLLVDAHLDTVPPNANWSADPFEARVAGGRVTGLGAADTKGAIAAILAALDGARPRDTGVLFSGDEEVGGAVMAAFLASPYARDVQRAVVCEPTGCRPGTRHRGILTLEARASGEGGHSSRADELASPLADVARIAVAWDDWGRAHRGRGPSGFPGMCVNIARLDGGIAFNVVPSQALLHASVRPPPGADQAAIRDELLALAARIAPGAEVRAVLENPPFATRDLAAFGALHEALGAAPMDLGFWTEAAMLQVAGLDAVVWGPGDIAQAHAPDEWIAIEQLERAREVFEQMFRHTAGGRDGAR